MESLNPLRQSTIQKWPTWINRTHTILHALALKPLFSYKTLGKNEIPMIPFLLTLASEVIFSFLWLLKACFGWRPITRTVYPERLVSDEMFPAIDFFICIADPKKEPPLDVMNTVISATSLDYPPEKLCVYLSDDGSSYLTFFAMREAWNFASISWIPFCRKFRIKNKFPKAFFLENDEDCYVGSLDFHQEIDNIEECNLVQ